MNAAAMHASMTAALASAETLLRDLQNTDEPGVHKRLVEQPAVTWALAFAGDYQVFPIWPVSEGRCTCASGAACRNRGRHPMINGLRSAVSTRKGEYLDPSAVAKIEDWFAKTPDAGVGVVIPSDCVSVLGEISTLSRLNMPARDDEPFLRTLSTSTDAPDLCEMVFRVESGKVLPDDLSFGLRVRQPGDFLVVHSGRHETEAGYLVLDVDVSPDHIARAPDWLAQQAASAPKRVCDPDLRLSDKPPPVNWLCSGLSIAPGRPTLLAAFAGGGKSPFAAAFATSVASGRPFLGMPVRQARVAWCAFETPDVTHTNLERFARGVGLDLGTLPIDIVPFTGGLNERTTMSEIRRRVRLDGQGLVVIDSYTSALTGVDHGSSSFGDSLRELARLSAETGATVLTLVHTTKAGTGGSGSREIAGHFSAVSSSQSILLLSRPNLKKPTCLRVSCLRGIFEQFPDFEIEFRNANAPPPSAPESPSWGLELRRAGDTTATAEGYILAAVAAMPKMNRQQIVDLVLQTGDYGRNETDRALETLVKDGRLVAAKVGTSTQFSVEGAAL